MKNAQKSRILILKFPYSSTFGGGEKHTLTLVEKLVNHEFFLLTTCSVLLPEFSKRDIPSRTTWAGIEPVTPKALLLFFFTAPFIALNLIVQLVRYKVQHKITVLFCLSLTEKVLLTPWARLLGIRVIWMEHLQIERWLLSSPLRILYVLWSRLATVVTVVEAVREQLISIGVPKENTKVIYNSIDINQFRPAPSDPDTILEQFDILFVGRLAKEKGVDDLINAVALVAKSIPQIHLTIVGEGEWQSDLEALVAELDIAQKVEFVGFQRNIPEWMKRSDTVVLPSTRRETFGIVMAEAMATMKPVITTSTGGVSEVVSRYGHIVEPHQPAAIAAAITEIFENYHVALDKAQKGRIHVIELFREDKMIQEYDQLFN